MLSTHVREGLEAAVGRRNCLTQPEDLICYGYDASRSLHLPEAVVLPETVEGVAAVLKLASRYGFPVIPRGAGSGVVGGTVPVRGGVVLAMNRMNRILAVDEENMTARVEPGVVTRKLQETVSRAGLFYPPDPASLSFSTIGGNIATGAGGPRAVKYGVTRDYVLGLEAVLPSGERIKTGVQTAKGVVGYDLTRLLVGSEGTLAVVTQAILKLIPRPEARRTLLTSFENLVQSARAITRIIQSKIVPCALEFMDRNAIRCVATYQNVVLPEAAGALLLIEIDGSVEAMDRQAEHIRKLCLEEGALAVEIAATEAESEKLWNARRAVAPALFQIKPSQISEDIVVPRNRIPAMVECLEEIGSRFRLDLVCFGHAGDGNIHVCIMVDPHDAKEKERAGRAVSEIFDRTIAYGGTISGEHGIGITKAPYLGKEIDRLGLDVMRRIKTAFDPNHILNPGKIFPDEV